uniref:Uncharacterized protein n=1 Tax=Rhizophora mucronata TaxID=61149 RepID=A0A2P2NIQ0_RHIMU
MPKEIFMPTSKPRRKTKISRARGLSSIHFVFLDKSLGAIFHFLLGPGSNLPSIYTLHTNSHFFTREFKVIFL